MLTNRTVTIDGVSFKIHTGKPKSWWQRKAAQKAARGKGSAKQRAAAKELFK